MKKKIRLESPPPQPRMPIVVSAGDIALGLAADLLMPPQRDIPRLFFFANNPWRIWADKWFHSGLDRWPVAVDGVDLQLAIDNLTVCIRGRDLSHLHKMMGVAYLASIWFSSTDGPPIDKQDMYK